MSSSLFIACRPRVYRVAMLSVVVVSMLAAQAAQAQGRRARLSEDLAKTLDQGDISTTASPETKQVILGGGQAKALRIAVKHGLRVSKVLATGAVLDVPSGSLAALASDAE